MKRLEVRLKTAAKENKTPQFIVEKDYALSYILAGLYSHEELRDALVFKGGTALKMIYFGDYRFSEDLDFSRAPSLELLDLEDAIEESILLSQKLLSKFGPFSITAERYTQKKPHPDNQEAFIVRIQFPWHRRGYSCPIKIEITPDELIVFDSARLPILHEYQEGNIDAGVLTYSLSEIVLEKMRSLLQTQKRLMERGWHRPRARDYYDLWRILRDYNNELPGIDLTGFLRNKCVIRNVDFNEIGDFFTDELLIEARANRETNLRVFVPGYLPPCDTVIDEQKSIIPKYFLELSI